LPPTHPRFKLVVDCGCGRRYFRHRVEEATDRETRSLCVCGAHLGSTSGAFSFRFESDKARRVRQSLAAGLSPHC
jgi:hypothetical protein